MGSSNALERVTYHSSAYFDAIGNTDKYVAISFHGPWHTLIVQLLQIPRFGLKNLSWLREFLSGERAKPAFLVHTNGSNRLQGACVSLAD
jgi:hypothetical protein